MKEAPRWPLHPAPREGEALSSWLHRVASCYEMDLQDLLEHDLGHIQVDDLETGPPMSLLTLLTQRSGVELDRLRCMSFAGFVPWLLDSLDNRIPGALETYTLQSSILLPKRSRKARSITRWRAWIPSRPIHRACLHCLNDPSNQAVLLAWKLPLMLSCPQHGCWLESYSGVPGRALDGGDTERCPRSANEAIAAMDQRTWLALTIGYVDLPRRRIHAGLWFRLLRGLLDELNTPLSQCGRYGGYIRHVWEFAGHPLRAGQGLWRPYEVLDIAVQSQMLEAAATAMNMIELGRISPPGELTALFMQEPQTEFTNGLAASERKTEPVDYLQAAIDEAVAEARYDRESARSLFDLASRGERDPESLQRLRDMFVKKGIPPEFLSH